MSAGKFKFEFDDKARINWRDVGAESVIERIIGGDLALMLAHCEPMAYADLEKETNVVGPVDHSGAKAVKLIQLGVQYLLFTNKHRERKLAVLEASLDKQKRNKENMIKLLKHQNDKIKKLKKDREMVDLEIN